MEAKTASVLFTFCIGYSLTFFAFLNREGVTKLWVIGGWMLVQILLSRMGFYENTEAFPPRMIFILFPIIIGIIWFLRSSRHQQLTHKDLTLATWSHAVRFPVEIVLYLLFLDGLVPKLMTFEGRNFDILVGITAPIVALLFHFGFIGNRILLIWNIIGLALVLFIMGNGILSVPSPIQQFAFDQPNIGVLQVPYICLPAIVVPIVVYIHLKTIHTLIGSRSKTD